MKRISLVFLLSFFSIFVSAQVKHIITSDGVDLYVTVKGKGTPCLYVHGGPGSGSYWLEHFIGDSLEKHFQMIYLDQRGVSRSTSPKDQNYSMERMVKDFEEVRVSLGIKKWITMGHSFGGLLQMGYANRFPNVIKGMIMINCTLDITESFKNSWYPKGCEFLNDTIIQPYMDESLSVSERWDSLIVALNKKDLIWKMGYSSKKNNDLMNSTFGEIPDWNWDFGAVAMKVKDYWNNFKLNTSDLSMPVLFFYGKSDWMVGPDHYEGVNFPNMILWGSDVGHMPFLENKDDLIKAISSYKKSYKL